MMRLRASRLRPAAVGALLLLVLVLPAFLSNYPRFVLSLALVNAVAAMGVNLSMGYAGQVSVGHAGFAALGAYTTALLMVRLDASYWLAVPAGALLAGVVGYAIGLPALRLSPLYISMVTFGFGQIVSYVSLNWLALTNGPNGIAVPPVVLFGEDVLPHAFYYVVAGAFLLLLWVCRNLAASRVGRAFVAVRDGEIAAQSMGVHLARYKTIAFAVGAFYGGASGGLYAGLSGYVNPDAFVFGVSILYLTMNVVGGMGTVSGPVLGALLFTVLPETLRGFAEYKEFLSGALLLAFLVFLPRGLVGSIARLAPRWLAAGRPSDRPVPLPAVDER